MGETNPGESDLDDDDSNSEQKNEEGGDDSKEENQITEDVPPAGDEESEDQTTDPAGEPTAGEETDPEAPAEEVTDPENPEETITVEGTEIMEKGTPYSATIENYDTLRDQITIKATVGGNSVKIPSNGVITAKEGDGEARLPIAVTFENTDGWEIQEIKQDGNKVSSVENITKDTTISVEVAAVYKVTLKAGNSGVTAIQITDKNATTENPPAISVSADATSDSIKKGDPAQDMDFTVDKFNYESPIEKLRVYYIADNSDDDDKEELTVKKTPTTVDGKTEDIYSYTVPAGVIDSLKSSIKIVLEKEEARDYADKIGEAVTAKSDDIKGVKYQAKKAEGTGYDWVASTADEKITKAFVGDKLSFQLVLKDDLKSVKEITGVTVQTSKDGEKTPIECKMDATNNLAECSFVVTKEIEDALKADPSTLAFEINTAYTTTSRNTLTYELGKDNDKGSVEEVKITSVTYGDETLTDSALTSFLGAENALVGEKGVDAPQTVIIPKKNATAELKSVVMTATIKAGYAVDVPKDAKGITFDPATRKATYTFAADGIAIPADGVMKQTITTKVATVAAETKKYFTVGIADTAKESLDTVEVTPVTGKVVKGKTSTEPATEYWEVASGVDVVTVKVTTKKDGVGINKLTGESNNIKGIERSTTVAASGDKLVYTVTLLASMIPSEDNTNPTSIVFSANDLKFKATAVSADEKVALDTVANVTAVTRATDADKWASYTLGSDVATAAEIAHGTQFKATITPKGKDYSLTKVSYTITDQFGNEGAAVDVPIDEAQVGDEENGDWVDEAAVISIPKLQGHVKITVEAAKKTADSYTLVNPSQYDAAKKTSTPLNSYTDKNEDGIWKVGYGETYLADVTNNTTGKPVPAKDIDVKVMDGGSAVSMTYPVVTVGEDVKATKHRSFTLKKSLAGKEITVEVSVKDGKGGLILVDTYRMQVSARTNTITVNGGNPIEQVVDQVKTYDIAINGELIKDNTKVTVGKGTDAGINNLIAPKITEDGKLQITTSPAARASIAENKGSETEPKWEPKEATIVVTAIDDENIETEVPITLKELFDPDLTPELGERDHADNALNMTLGMAINADEELMTGSLKYEVTVEPDKATDTNKLPEGFLSSVTVDSSKLNWEKGTKNLEIPVTDGKQLGEGGTWGYTVIAKLVYTKGDVKFESKPVEAKPSTQGLKFENNLKLKKIKGAPAAVYTGQSDSIEIAEPQWTTKIGPYKITESTVLVDGKEDNANGLSARMNAVGNLEITDVAKNAQVGKHTITVIAKADKSGADKELGEQHTTYASRATITVNVVKGINSLSLDSRFNSKTKISKLDTKKAVTVKTNLVYNNSTSNYSSIWSWDGKKYVSTPKSKNVKWSIVGVESRWENGEGTIVDAPAYLNANNAKTGASVKNGNITVAKGWMPDTAHPSYNKFKILVEANDFTGNTTKKLSEEIEITGEAVDLTNLVVVKRIQKSTSDDDQTGYYGDQFEVVAAKEGKAAVSVSADKLDGAFVYALNTPLKKGDTLSYSKWKTIREEAYTNLSFKSSSEKMLKVSPISGHLTVVAPGKKATLTVTAEDGSKKKETLALQIDYKSSEGKDLALKIGTSYDGNDIWNPKKAETPVTKDFTATGAARIYVRVVEGKSFTDFSEFTNYDLKVKGGKIVNQDQDDKNAGYATIVSTSKTTTLTLTDPNVAKGEKKKIYTYTLTNKAYDGLEKAPKVTVNGSLHWTGSEKEQTIKLNLKDIAKNTKVMVEMDYSAEPKYNEKNNGPRATFWALAENLAGNNNSSNVFTTDENSNITLNLYTSGQYTPGSYKLKVTPVKGSKLEPTTLPASVTIKVVKDKAFTFKPATALTYNKIDGGARLTGKANVNAKLGEGYTVEFSNVQNENQNGISNKFTHYFVLDQDPVSKAYRLVLNRKSAEVQELLYNKDKDGKINLNDPIANPEITEAKIGKENLTGYVHFEAAPSVGYYTNGSVSGDVKVKVKIAAEPKAGKAAKASSKYVPQNAEIDMKKDKTTQVNVMVNGAYVDVAYAIIDTEKSGNTEGLILDPANKSGTKDGQIVFKTSQALADGQKCTANLLIVPKGSFYEELISKAPDKAAAKALNADGDTTTEGGTTPTPTTQTKEDLIKLYGISVKVTLVAKEKPAETPSNKPATDVVATVSVSPQNPSVAQEASQKFTAVAWNANGDVVANAGTATWTVTGGNGKSNIGADGTLTVAADETVGTKLTVTATIGGKSGTATVTVTAKSDTPDTPPAEEDPVDEVTVSITGNDSSTEYEKNKSIALTATPKKGGSAITETSDLEISWKLEGATDTSSTSLPDALTFTNTLTVGANETGTLKITVTVKKKGSSEGGKPGTLSLTLKGTSGSPAGGSV